MSHVTPQLDLSLLFMSANCRTSYAVTVMAGRRDRASGGGGIIDTGSFLRNLFVPSQAQFQIPGPFRDGVSLCALACMTS